MGLCKAEMSESKYGQSKAVDVYTTHKRTLGTTLEYTTRIVRDNTHPSTASRGIQL